MANIGWAESYLGRLRASAGDTDTLLFVGARGVVLDDDNRILLIQRSDNGRGALPAGAEIASRSPGWYGNMCSRE